MREGRSWGILRRCEREEKDGEDRGMTTHHSSNIFPLQVRERSKLGSTQGYPPLVRNDHGLGQAGVLRMSLHPWKVSRFREWMGFPLLERALRDNGRREGSPAESTVKDEEFGEECRENGE